MLDLCSKSILSDLGKRAKEPISDYIGNIYKYDRYLKALKEEKEKRANKSNKKLENKEINI